ncbi:MULTISPECIES: GMC oxidoreductase [unclassified Arthrobacter]|uniref:GMC oxidoreductase n=1 Tax=unclassified Arthrobacter TaxID=235627 RepID=UPI001C859DA9|nr:GMC oxidoreductase [Arthrobacter sp. MAHUQ-56]MBX7444613.1 GMC family oxidoreductase N-terminal domain-containing protein [Arthrobacter sp. MAHUQ-56]
MSSPGTSFGHNSESVDVLIIGSGPAGSAHARRLYDLMPEANILMIDAGPRLTETWGRNVRNLPVAERGAAQKASEGSHTDGQLSGDAEIVARPGTHLVRPFASGSLQKDMPAAAMSTNVGGMGAHWTCACPPPGGSEKIDFIDGAVLDKAFDEARRLLRVTQTAFPETPANAAIRRTLSKIYDEGRPAARRVQAMPLACEPTGGPLPEWTGADKILAALSDSQSWERFEIRDRTVCERLLTEPNRVSGASLRDLRTGRSYTVQAAWVVVAADSLRTPQLLWASGIRPPALGHYLNDQPQIVSAIEIDPGKVSVTSSEFAAAADLADNRDQLKGVLWIPFDDERHPFHGQIMQMETAPITVDGVDISENEHLVTFGWFAPKDIQFEDCVTFDEAQLDDNGLPAMRITYTLTEKDQANIAAAIADLDAAVTSLGRYASGGEARLLPAGSSLHYQGSYRIGPLEDGTSVCDSRSRVWGFENLYLAGNGLIPTATACNPTLTSLALAVLATDSIADSHRPREHAFARENATLPSSHLDVE